VAAKSAPTAGALFRDAISHIHTPYVLGTVCCGESKNRIFKDLRICIGSVLDTQLSEMYKFVITYSASSTKFSGES
jgi:hypothetical protein